MKRLIVFALLIATVSLSLPSLPPLVQAKTEEEIEKICILYFYRADCGACAAIKPFIDSIEQEYADFITIHRYDIARDLEGYKLYNRFCSIQQVPIGQRGVPLVAISDRFLMGVAQIKENLKAEIERMIETGEKICPLEEAMACHLVEETNQTEPAVLGITEVTFPLVTVAALADSINPCAIGVLIFLLSFLLITSAGNVRRAMRIAGLYIATVYLVYLLAGIGILTILTRLGFLTTLTKVFAIGIALFGVFNIREYFVQDRGKGAKLAIPARAKPVIERWVYRASLPAAVVLGFIVAAFELPCTGGMYLAILALLANVATRAQAIPYLLYYNFLFVLPLSVLTGLFVAGMQAEKLREWFERHRRKARLLMGIVLVVLGIVLLVL